MKKALIWFFPTVLGVVLAVAFALTLSFYIRSSGSPGNNPVQAQLKSLRCDLWTDEQSVTHARTEQKLAAFACAGYLHGRDRAWQMDFFRRTLQGRKSEVLGASELRSDFAMRLMGLDTRGEKIFNSMASDLQSLLWAYSYGVNRGLDESVSKGVYEFQELGYRPDYWRPQDSVALLLLQGFDQTRKSFLRQIDEDGFERDWGADAARLFAREGSPWDTTILKPGEPGYLKPESPAASSSKTPTGTRVVADPARSTQRDAFFGESIGRGSNNWVIAPARSATGHAWLANDPHLDLKHPPFWYWLHIESPEFDVIGATLPGVPGIASGANRHVAWGITNSYLNVARLAYVSEDELKGDAKVLRPWIWVKVGPMRLPFFFKTLRRTSQDWPILPEGLTEAQPPGYAAVLRWSGFELEAEDLRGSYELLESKSVVEADRALSRFRVPSWNFVFADDQGKIGYRAVGKVPANAESLPFGIARMKLGEFQSLAAFNRFLSVEEMPHLLSPKRGYIATANNRQWPENSNWRIGSAHAEGFRAYRIEELIQQTPQHDLESIRKSQCDVLAMDARFMLEPLLQALQAQGADHGQDPRVSSTIAALKKWDKQASFNCAPCTVFRRWVERIYFDQGLDEGSLYRKLSDGGEGIQKVVQVALTQALDDLKVPADGTLPLWKDLHRSFFSHLVGGDRFVAPSISTMGDDQTVNPGSSHWDGALFRHTTGASQRMIVELTSPPQVHAVLAGSNGDVADRDPAMKGSAWQKWANCEQQRRVFPVDWSQVRSRPLIFE